MKNFPYCGTIFFAIFVLVFLFCPAIFAQEIEKADSVPSDISDTDYQDLVQRRQTLDERRETLTGKMDTFNAACGSVSSDNTAQVDQCTHDRQDLISKIDDYKRDLVEYEKEILKARSAATKKVPLNNQEADKAAVEIVKQRLETVHKKAKAFAALNLGAYLMDYKGQKDLAISYLKEARQFLSEERDPDLNEALIRIIYDKERQESLPSLHDMFPIYQSKVQAVLDALDYGNGNWDESVKYLEVAHGANPNDLNVRDALNYVQGFAAVKETKKQ